MNINIITTVILLLIVRISFAQTDNNTMQNSAPSTTNGRYYFAKLINTNISFLDNCTTDTLADGATISSLEIGSQGAYSIGLRITGLYLAQGAELNFYTPQHLHSLESVGRLNNKKDSTLRTAQLPGDTIIVELYLPAGTKQNDFIIAKVCHDYANVLEETTSIKKSLQKSSCATEIDINCDEGQDYQDIKHAILKYSVDKDGYTYLCTGTLVNNINCDGTPYVLTAAHCVCDDEDAQNTVFYFNYERTICGQTTSTNTKTIEGAELIATAPKEPYTNNQGKTSTQKYPTLDFTLLKLSKPINQEYQPYFAGISLSETDNIKQVTCIHHPNGDYKKISLSNKAPYQDTYPEEDEECHYNDFSHWHIQSWAAGTTESGSSGAPLLNQNKQIIGILSGGYANCTNPNNDYFQMVSKAWSNYSSNVNQLKHWLALDTDVSEIQPYNPYNVGQLYPNSQIYAKINSDTTSVLLSWEPTATGIFNEDFEDMKENSDIRNSFLANVDMDYDVATNLPIVYEGENEATGWFLLKRDFNDLYPPYEGNVCIASATATETTTNDYLTLNKITVTSTAYNITFWARSIGGTSQLKIAQNTKPTRYQAITTFAIDEKWQQYTVSLSDFIGSTIFINFNNITPAGESKALLIDNIIIDKESNANTPQLIGYQLYCNGELVTVINNPNTTHYYQDIEKNNLYTFYVFNVYQDGGISNIGNSVTINTFPTTPTNDITPSSATSNVIAFPNPVEDILYVKIPSSYNTEVKIYDIIGKLIDTQTATPTADGLLQIYTQSLKSGLYIIAIGNTRIKIIKQ